MSRYLSALKISENWGATTLQNLQNPALDSFVGFVGTPPPPFEIKQAANDDTDQAENVTCFAWRIHFADRDPVTVTFSPMATHAAALACYPDALAAEPIPGTPNRTPTAEESAHLAMLMMAIYGDDSEDDRTEALQAALADPDNALACYTAIASEHGLTLPDGDDRRTCRQCANLRGGACSVACPGGAVSANRGYRPAADLLQRCEAFNERTL